MDKPRAIRHPRLAMMAAIVALMFCSTWAGMAYARGAIDWYVVFGLASSVLAVFIYFLRIPALARPDPADIP